MRSGGPPLPPFANDLARTLRTIEMSTDHVAALDGPNFLSTVMFDFMLQTAFKEDSLPPNILVGSSNSMAFFETHNNKFQEHCNGDKTAQRSVTRMRKGYSQYGLGQYRFLAATCIHSHFFVVDVTFDPRNDNIFKSVTVYNSQENWMKPG
jgi:hypothetical protein